MIPGNSNAGSWYVRDFPAPVGNNANVFAPLKTRKITSICPGLNTGNPNPRSKTKRSFSFNTAVSSSSLSSSSFVSSILCTPFFSATEERHSRTSAMYFCKVSSFNSSNFLRFSAARASSLFFSMSSSSLSSSYLLLLLYKSSSPSPTENFPVLPFAFRSLLSALRCFEPPLRAASRVYTFGGRLALPALRLGALYVLLRECSLTPRNFAVFLATPTSGNRFACSARICAAVFFGGENVGGSFVVVVFAPPSSSAVFDTVLILLPSLIIATEFPSSFSISISSAAAAAAALPTTTLCSSRTTNFFFFLGWTTTSSFKAFVKLTFSIACISRLFIAPNLSFARFLSSSSQSKGSYDVFFFCLFAMVANEEDEEKSPAIVPLLVLLFILITKLGGGAGGTTNGGFVFFFASSFKAKREASSAAASAAFFFFSADDTTDDGGKDDDFENDDDLLCCCCFTCRCFLGGVASMTSSSPSLSYSSFLAVG